MARRLAMVVGNAMFEDAQAFPTLRTPLNDGRDFAEVLAKYGGFEVFDILTKLQRGSDERLKTCIRLQSGVISHCCIIQAMVTGPPADVFTWRRAIHRSISCVQPAFGRSFSVMR